AVLSPVPCSLVRRRHLVDVGVVNWVPRLAPVGLDVREQAAIDVEKLATGELDDGVVDRIFLAAGPEPNMRAELVGVPAVEARSRQPADTAVLLDDGDVVTFFREVVRDRRARHAAAQNQHPPVHLAPPKWCCFIHVTLYAMGSSFSRPSR